MSKTFFGNFQNVQNIFRTCQTRFEHGQNIFRTTYFEQIPNIFPKCCQNIFRKCSNVQNIFRMTFFENVVKTFFESVQMFKTYFGKTCFRWGDLFWINQKTRGKDLVPYDVHLLEMSLPEQKERIKKKRLEVLVIHFSYRPQHSGSNLSFLCSSWEVYAFFGKPQYPHDVKQSPHRPTREQRKGR